MPISMRIHLLALAVLASALAACGGGDRPAAAPGDSAAVASPADSSNASPAADTAGGISGADGVAFGTKRERILADRGQPEYTNDDHEGVQSVGYPTTLMDQQAQVIFLTHPQHGMMRASYMVPVESVDRCQSVLGLLEQGLARTYGELRVTPPRTPVASACADFARDGAPWMKRWTDARDREIMLALLPGTPGVVLTYSTPEAADWEQRRVTSPL